MKELWQNVRLVVPRTVRLAAAGAGISTIMACAGGAYVDGYDAMYVENPPPDVAVYPRYPFHDGYVYDVRGQYYHRHEGRWVAYPHPPREIDRYRR